MNKNNIVCRSSYGMIGQQTAGLPPSGHKGSMGNGNLEDDDEDCLSYSSTEQDISEHAGLNSLTHPINLSFGNGNIP